jgi:hypothetical protein
VTGDQANEQHPHGALLSARKAVGQDQETVSETAVLQSIFAQENMPTHDAHFCSPCVQVSFTGGKKVGSCQFVSYFLCTTTDHINTFHTMQQCLCLHI